MTAPPASVCDPPQFLPRADLSRLFLELERGGYTILGPTIRQGAIVYDRLTSVDDLPRGWTERQEAGIYRLEPRADDRLFGYTVGPQSWKQFLFPPTAIVATAIAAEEGWTVTAATEDDAPRFAFVGMRACDLAAVAVQDRVFLQEHYADPIYQARRERALFIAVNCTQAAPTCFCASMHTGPRCTTGFDLALTELESGFVLEIGTERGRAIAAALDLQPARAEDLQHADTERQQAVDQQVRSLPKEEVRELLLGNLQHPQWDDVAERCLSCTNCTQVCPTCFCSSVREVTDLDVTRVDRERTWDSCFNFDFSYMNGGVVRNSVRARYRQWLTHKLATWHDQFDVSGCVGCGRCITWCPVGIDLTAEIAALRGTPS
jgi:sulfhydrogenase subunit beta (sulfur reductase)